MKFKKSNLTESFNIVWAVRIIDAKNAAYNQTNYLVKKTGNTIDWF